MAKKVLVLGAGGFIGSHLAKKLKKEGAWVRGVDIKRPEFSPTAADEFVVGDLRDPQIVGTVLDQPFDEVYQLAADMGGAGYLFSGEHDADVMHNSATINLNVAWQANNVGVKKIFFSSSACIYPEYNQLDPDNPKLSEDSAYPAAPDSEYGWEKLFSERLYLSFHRNYGLNVRIARFHNIFGPEGTWRGGKEKAPAAISRKVAEASLGLSGIEIWTPTGGRKVPSVDIWGDGMQTRSFLYIDECLEGVSRLMNSNFTGPVNIGSDEMVTLNELAQLTAQIAGISELAINHIPGPLGVRGRNSDNKLIREKLGWAPSQKLQVGMTETYNWIKKQLAPESKG